MNPSLRDIMRRETARSPGETRVRLGARALDRALNGGLARGALHEIAAAEAGDLGAAHGFALALAGLAAGPQGQVLWVQDEMAALEDGAPYGPGLAMQGLDPGRLVLVRVPHPRTGLWVMEQALRCRALRAVVGEIARAPAIYDLTASRRLVLAARESGAAMLLVHAAIGGGGAGLSTAAATRWSIAAHPSRPGRAGEPGEPSWRVALTRNRGGIEGTWTVEWNHDERAFRDRETLPGRVPADAGDGPYPAFGAALGARFA